MNRLIEDYGDPDSGIDGVDQYLRKGLCYASADAVTQSAIFTGQSCRYADLLLS